MILCRYMPTKNKELQAKLARAHYLRNKKVIKKRAAEFKTFAIQRNYKFINRVKRRFGCKDCGMTNPVCLDFHHHGNKTMDVCRAVNSGWSIESLKVEIRKCSVLCSNCHRIRTSVAGK